MAATRSKIGLTCKETKLVDIVHQVLYGGPCPTEDSHTQEPYEDCCIQQHCSCPTTNPPASLPDQSLDDEVLLAMLKSLLSMLTAAAGQSWPQKPGVPAH